MRTFTYILLVGVLFAPVPPFAQAEDEEGGAAPRAALGLSDPEERVVVSPRSAPDHPVVSEDAQNTALNQRDGSDRTKTPFDQGTSEHDRQLAAAIRQAIVADKTLSIAAHNVKIIVRDGEILLRGPVKGEREHQRVVAEALRVSQASSVIDKLDIEREK